MSVVQNPGRYNSVSLSAHTRQNYTVNSYFPSRKPRPNSLKGLRQRTFGKDINDNMQHATLINIVAAVNEDIGNQQPELRKGSVSTYSSNRSNMTIVSNIVFPHDKTISIPQTKQRDFSVPEKVVQRKPVYYKHSKDLEVHNQSHHIRLFEDGDSYNFNVKLSKRMEKEKGSIEVETKTKYVTMDKTTEDVKKTKTDDKNNKIPRDCELRISSGVRRLGTLKQSEPRQLHELHKCDAIDLLDKSIDSDDLAKSVLDDSRKLIPTTQMNRIPYIRTKSLPVMFPTKSTNKSTWSVSSAAQKQPLVLTDRPLSKSLRQRTPDSMYRRISNLPGGFGFGEMSINNGVNEAPDIAAPLVHDSSKYRKVAATIYDRLKRSRHIRSPSSPTLGRETQNKFIMTSDDDEEIYHNRRIAYHSNLYKSKRALHEAVKRVLTGRSLVCETTISRRIPIEERKEIHTYKRSYQPTRPTTNEMHNDKTVKKKVQFQRSESSAGSSDISSKGHERNVEEIQGGSNILKKEPSSIRSFSPGIQPMSTRELLRLEQKILPINGQSPIHTDNAVFFSTSSGINLQRSNSDLSIKLNSNSSSSDIKDENADSNEGNESFVSDNNENGDNGEADIEYDDAYIHKMGHEHSSDFYKIVKAVDNNPYNGYEHKKLRRSVSSVKSKETDSTKAQYIKVKLG